MARHFTTHQLLIVLYFFFSNFSNPRQSVQADDVLIQKTCKSTKYSDLCISALQSDPTSTQSDLKGLAAIMVNVGILNATDTYTYLSSQLLNSASDGNLKKVLHLCAGKYSYANDSLKSAIDDLAAESYDYASVHVTAAGDYPNACRNAFKQYRGLRYPAQLKAREDGLKRICDVLLGILDQLYSISVLITSHF